MDATLPYEVDTSKSGNKQASEGNETSSAYAPIEASRLGLHYS